MPLDNHHEEIPVREWVTITNVGPDPDHQDAIAVDWIRDDGKPGGRWPNADPSGLVAYWNP